SAVHEIVQALGLPITLEEAAVLQPVLKARSEAKGGELSDAEVAEVYEAVLLSSPGPLEFKALRVNADETEFTFDVVWKGEARTLKGSGTGPVDASVKALESLGIHFHLAGYSQQAVDAERSDSAAFALSEIRLQKKDA